MEEPLPSGNFILLREITCTHISKYKSSTRSIQEQSFEGNKGSQKADEVRVAFQVLETSWAKAWRLEMEGPVHAAASRPVWVNIRLCMGEQCVRILGRGWRQMEKSFECPVERVLPFLAGEGSLGGRLSKK